MDRVVGKKVLERESVVEDQVFVGGMMVHLLGRLWRL